MTGILAGLRVVEVSAFVAAPLAGLTLAQLGADVIRVDPIGGGVDYGRWPLAPSGASMYWAGLNKGKRSVAADLRSDAGRDLVSRLVTAPGPDGGILVTNLAPSWLDYDRLRELRPDVICVVLSGSSDGAIAVDYTVNAAVGYPAVTGAEGGVANHVLPAWDVVAGNMLATAVLAAERHRSRTGQGQLVALTLSDVAHATVGHLGHIAEVVAADQDRQAYGNFVYGTFGADFPTGDGRRVMVVALTPRQWRALTAATGTGEQFARIEQERDWDLTDEGTRFEARHDIAAIVGEWVAARTLADVAAAFDDHRVCWGPYRTFRQMVEEDPRVSAANPMFAEVDQPGIGRHLAPGSPLSFSAGPRLPPMAAPIVGEHTEEVLREVAGLSGAEIAELRAGAVI